MSLIVAKKYKIISKLGEGSFGKIFSGVNINTDEEVAVKIEKLDEHSLLKNEASVYKLLENISGIPRLRSYGTEGKFNYMVIDLLDKSLEDMRITCGNTLSLKTVLVLGIQMLKRIECVHLEGIIHRDIKPDNFLIKNNNNQIYLIDFGLSKRYLDSFDKHIKINTGRKLMGTARYASINVHNGITPTRRDDIESIGYVLLYLLIGYLPWQSIKADTREKRYKLIGKIKKETDLWNISKDIPGELILFINYCRNLSFYEEPNYNYLKNLLGNLFKLHGFTADIIYK
jgi:serine/threonine protein kinase